MTGEREQHAERVLESERIFEGKIARLRRDTVRLPDGRTAEREIVEHDDVVAIVPLTDEGDVVLVRQYRLAAGAALLEVPAGIVDPGEEAEEAAQRELQEEVGLRAGRLERLCGFYVSPGFCTEFVHVFLARGLVESRLDGDPDENITVETVPLAEAVRMTGDGRIADGKSIVGILSAAFARDLLH